MARSASGHVAAAEGGKTERGQDRRHGQQPEQCGNGDRTAGKPRGEGEG
jgi:hypothetical protein